MGNRLCKHIGNKLLTWVTPNVNTHVYIMGKVNGATLNRRGDAPCAEGIEGRIARKAFQYKKFLSLGNHIGKSYDKSYQLCNKSRATHHVSRNEDGIRPYGLIDSSTLQREHRLHLVQRYRNISYLDICKITIIQSRAASLMRTKTGRAPAG